MSASQDAMTHSGYISDIIESTERFFFFSKSIMNICLPTIVESVESENHLGVNWRVVYDILLKL